MTKKEKEIAINSLSKSFSSSKSFYIVDPSGLAVNDINFIRRQCFVNKVEYVVAKNTFVLKALNDNQREGFASHFDEVFKGTTGIFFLNEESANFPAKLIKNFRKQKSTARFLLKGAYIDGDIYIGENSLEMLSILKTKKELVGDVIAALQASAGKVISALTNFEGRGISEEVV